MDRARPVPDAELLNAILDASWDAIVCLDPEGRVISWNRGAERLFGWTSAEMLGRPVADLWPEGDATSQARDVLERMRRGERVELESLRRRKDGREVEVALVVTPVRDPSGRLLGSSAVIRDVTHVRRDEAEREALVAHLERTIHFAERFMGVLAHDLRNPLTAITTIVQVLRRGESDPKSQAAFDRVVSSAHRMSRMIDQLLDVTRLRLGRGLRLRGQETDLSDLVMDAVDELEEAYPDRSFDLELRGDLVGVWDSDRLAEAVGNLLGNAVEHGQADREVRVRVDGTDPDRIRFTVENEGGLPDGIAESLFEPFAAGAQKPPGKGLGLGLYITREVVQAHGGELLHDAREPGWTRFVLTLPRRLPREEEREAFSG